MRWARVRVGRRGRGGVDAEASVRRHHRQHPDPLIDTIAEWFDQLLRRPSQAVHCSSTLRDTEPQPGATATTTNTTATATANSKAPPLNEMLPMLTIATVTLVTLVTLIALIAAAVCDRSAAQSDPHPRA